MLRAYAKTVVSYDPASILLFSNMAVQPSNPVKQLYNTIIASLKTTGIWGRLDILYVLAVGTNQQAGLNWKSPGNFTMTDVPTPVFKSNRGVTGDTWGGTGSKNTNWKASVNAVQYTLNDASLFAWSGTNTRSDGNLLFSDVTALTSYVSPWAASLDTVGHGLNSAGANAFAPGAANGLYSTSRTSSASYIVYRNATSLGTQSTTSSAVPTNFHYVGAPDITLMAGLGASLTAQNMTDLYNTFSTYFTAIGAPQ